MTRERRLTDSAEAYLGPVAIAQFVAVGWLVEWPLMLTRGGAKALRGGAGTWHGTRQRLPIPCAELPSPAAYWEGRRG